MGDGVLTSNYLIKFLSFWWWGLGGVVGADGLIR